MNLLVWIVALMAVVIFCAADRRVLTTGLDVMQEGRIRPQGLLSHRAWRPTSAARLGEQLWRQESDPCLDKVVIDCAGSSPGEFGTCYDQFGKRNASRRCCAILSNVFDCVLTKEEAKACRTYQDTKLGITWTLYNDNTSCLKVPSAFATEETCGPLIMTTCYQNISSTSSALPRCLGVMTESPVDMRAVNSSAVSEIGDLHNCCEPIDKFATCVNETLDRVPCESRAEIGESFSYVLASYDPICPEITNFRLHSCDMSSLLNCSSNHSKPFAPEIKSCEMELNSSSTGELTTTNTSCCKAYTSIAQCLHMELNRTQCKDVPRIVEFERDAKDLLGNVCGPLPDIRPGSCERNILDYCTMEANNEFSDTLDICGSYFDDPSSIPNDGIPNECCSVFLSIGNCMNEQINMTECKPHPMLQQTVSKAKGLFGMGQCPELDQFTLGVAPCGQSVLQSCIANTNQTLLDDCKSLSNPGLRSDCCGLYTSLAHCFKKEMNTSRCSDVKDMHQLYFEALDSFNGTCTSLMEVGLLPCGAIIRHQCFRNAVRYASSNATFCGSVLPLLEADHRPGSWSPSLGNESVSSSNWVRRLSTNVSLPQNLSSECCQPATEVAQCIQSAVAMTECSEYSDLLDVTEDSEKAFNGTCSQLIESSSYSCGRRIAEACFDESQQANSTKFNFCTDLLDTKNGSNAEVDACCEIFSSIAGCFRGKLDETSCNYTEEIMGMYHEAKELYRNNSCIALELAFAAVPTPNSTLSVAPTPTASFSPGETCCAPTPAACFPAHVKVILQDGLEKTVSELKVGDRVLTASGTFSEVYFFGHRVAHGMFPFLRLITSLSHLDVSDSHLLVVNDGALVPAKQIVVGDQLHLADETKVTVTSIVKIQARGLFNPHTVTGSIVVNGVKASCFTSTVNPFIAEALLVPIRMLYYAGIRTPNFLNEDSPKIFTSLIPSHHRPIYV